MSLHAQNLSCERNGRLVFSDLNFTIAAGECAELRGGNGAGKSSLLRVLAGLLPLTTGTATFDGAADFAQRLHFISHQNAMKSAMTVTENLQFWCNVLGEETIDKALDAFQLRSLEHELVQLLSAGQRRRLALSRLFLRHRPLWLLDEPMTALDQATQVLMRDHIVAHLKNNGIVIAATHGDLGITSQHVITLGDA